MAALRDTFLVGLNAVMVMALLGLVTWPLPELGGKAPAPRYPAHAPPAAVFDRPAQFSALKVPHPVFWPRPAEPPSTTTPAEVPTDQPTQPMPRLVGLMVRSGAGLAVFEIPGEHETRTLREGETVAGWTLERISARAVRLAQHGHRVVLPLDPGRAP